MTNKPISTLRWVHFLKCLGIVLVRQGKGDHSIFDRSESSLLRSIPVRLNYKEVPPTHIKTALITIRMSGIQEDEINTCAGRSKVSHVLR